MTLTSSPAPAEAPAFQPDPHVGLHAEAGALPGEHPGRDTDPVIKVRDLAWLEFEKPDLERAALFAEAFGFTVASRTPDELVLRGTAGDGPCVVIRRGRRSRFTGPVFLADSTRDLVRLADELGASVTALPENLGGHGVSVHDPSGLTVKVVAELTELEPLATPAPKTFNFNGTQARTNATQRTPHAPAPVERLGHVVLQSSVFRTALDWYLRHLGLIVSDFLYFDGQRERGPVMAFIRCDRGSEPTDHHTLAMTLGPTNRYVHSAYQVADLDTLAAGGEYLLELGYKRSWGIGRHIQGSQIFDYWRDPDGFMVEHFADGDRFDSSLEPGWAPMTVTGLAQWGPRATADFLGTRPSLAAFRELGLGVRSMREANEWDLERLRGLIQAGRS